MRFKLVEENELDKLANSAKKKNKKKHQQGWFVTLGGNPEKNAEMFNTATNTGDAPTSSCSEELDEQLKNEYEICYLDYKDHKYTTYIDAYSEKQAALILRKTTKGVKRIVYIDCTKDHSQDDGEQLKLFDESLSNEIDELKQSLSNMKIGDSVTVKNYKNGDIYTFVKRNDGNQITAFENIKGKNHLASPQHVFGWAKDSIIYGNFTPIFDYKNK